MPAVYCASKSKHWPWWQALRAAGLDIRASWISWSHNMDDSEPTADEWVWLPRTQIRAYRWCSPPRIGCAIMSPNRSIGRVQGASLPSERCVRTSL
jgi:hypothetical protein